MVELEYKDGKKVRIEFGEKEHTYSVSRQYANGEWTEFSPTHGITTPLSKTVDKPFIAPWVAKLSVHETLKFAHENPDIVTKIPEMFDDLAALDAGEITYYKFSKSYPWLSKLKSVYKDASKEGKDLGTWIHKAIEDYFNNGNTPVLTHDTEGMWKSFIQFVNLYKPKPEALEFVVYSILYGYSGMGDFRGHIGGRYCIGDWKSTNRSESNRDGISFDNFFQLGGLAQAEFERTGSWPDDVFIANIDKGGREPIIIWASNFGMAPEDCAKAYIAHLIAYKQQTFWDYKFKEAK